MSQLDSGVRDPSGGSASIKSVSRAEEIGDVIGRTPRQTHHLLTRSAIKSAKKIGGRWMASRSALLREFGA